MPDKKAQTDAAGQEQTDEDKKYEKEFEKEFEKTAEATAERISKEIEGEVEAKVTRFFESDNFKYMAEGFFGAFFTVIWMILVIVFWDRIALFNDDFEKMYDIIYISTAINVIMYGVLVLMRAKWFKVLRNVIGNILALIFFVILLDVYPFAFGGDWDLLEHLMKPLIYII
ncbi:hypothetical protein GF389_03195, partial [Candidatus Dojkabacteria bacterium]|nr:hypothetical protein [Candidatus Dojkabacteria bacterium]